MAWRALAGSVVGGLLAATVVFIGPARAAEVNVVGIGSSGACAETFGFGFCYVVDGKLTSTLQDGDKIVVVNPITARVGDTISIAPGVHNLIFCTPGTVITNTYNPDHSWTCGDPVLYTPGPWPQSIPASTPGAPQKIGYDDVALPYSTTLTTEGEFYFWCGIGAHAKFGQVGKLIVLPALPTTTTSTTTTTPPTTTVAPVAVPTLSLKRSGGNVVASGRTEPRGKVSLQKKVGNRWVTVVSTTSGRTGAYSMKTRAPARSTLFRVKVGSSTSASRRSP